MKSKILFSFLVATVIPRLYAVDTVKAYRDRANDVLRLVAKNADSGKVVAAADEMVTLAKTLLERYVAKNPDCQAYLDATVKALADNTDLSYEEIERKFHQGTGLPKAVEKCHDAKDLIVHPAEVKALAKNVALDDTSKAKIRHEITEVLEHLQHITSEVR